MRICSAPLKHEQWNILVNCREVCLEVGRSAAVSSAEPCAYSFRSSPSWPVVPCSELLRLTAMRSAERASLVEWIRCVS